MKTNKWIYAIMIASLCWVACDNDDDDKENKPSLNETDEAFVEKAALSNHTEITFGELASTKATDSLVRAFALDMVEAHTSAQNELKGIADDFNGIDWPDELDQNHKNIHSQLDSLEGYSFDSLYIHSQVMDHESAVAAFETAATASTDARVKSYAGKYLPHIEMHLQQADSIKSVISIGVLDITEDGTTDAGTN